MDYLETITIIADALAMLGIPFTANPLYDGWQLRFPWSDGDIACHSYTYGSSKGHVESYMFSWDDGDVTELTPEEAAFFILREWSMREE